MPLLIEWTQAALQDTDAIVDFIFEDNPTAAIEMEQLIHDSTDNLAFMPYIGRRGRVENTREFVFHPNYFIVYETAENRIKILNVLHTRRQYP